MANAIKDFTINIIQWNAQSLRPKKWEFEALLNQEKVHIAVLSETWLEEDAMITFSGYNLYRKDREDSYGGVAILVHNSIESYQCPVSLTNTGIEAVHVKVKNCKYLNDIISIYCPSSVYTTQADWDCLFSKMSKFTIIAGDFNGHHSNWSFKCDSRGKQLYDSSMEHGFVSLNSKVSTRIKLVNGLTQKSSPDVTFVSTDIVLYLNWHLLNETLGSDHTIIKLSMKYQDNLQFSVKRNFRLADWAAYRTYIEENVASLSYSLNDVQNMYDSFINIINKSADEYIPFVKICKNPTQKFIPKSYWNPNLSKIVAERRLALKEFRKNPIPQKLEILEHKVAASKAEISKARSHNWHTFCNSLNESSSDHQVWKKMCWVKGRRHNRLFAPKKEKEKMLCDLAPDTATICQPIVTSSNPSLEKEFVLEELLCCIKKKDTAPGEDGITYSMIHQLSLPTKKFLLHIYNLIFKYALIPEQWRCIQIVPIPKANSSSNSDVKLRPISLISCLCKIFHSMITKRLEWFVETNKILDPVTVGFRRSHSCMDALSRLISYIQVGFSENISTLACFLDIESAYNNVLIDRTIAILDDLSVGSLICNYLWAFLSKRKLKIKEENNYNNCCTRYTSRGLAQGDPMSPLLFNIVTHTICKNIKDVVVAQYADDFVLYVKNKNMNTSVDNLQDSIKIIVTLLNNLGLEVSPNKTKVCVFSRKRRVDDFTIMAGNVSLQLVPHVKYLGMWLDKGLLFSKHVNELCEKVTKQLNLLKILVGPSWGVHPLHLRKLYIALIRSKMDYACFLYDCSASSHIAKLDKIQNQALRIIGGFIRTTPIHVMENELCIPPLFLRRQYLALKFCIKARSWTNNETIKLVKELGTFSEGRYWQKKKKPLLSLVYKDVKDEKLFASYPLVMFMLNVWVSRVSLFNVIFISLDSAKHPKISYEPNSLKVNVINELNDKYSMSHKIFTDGSKSKDGIGASYYDSTLKVNAVFKIVSGICIMSAELFAISEAITYASNLESKNIVIFTDSKSALQHIARCASWYRGTALAYKVLQKLNSLPADVTLKLQWIPSHIGLKGNEEADRLARYACTRGDEVFVRPDFSEILPKFKAVIYNKWKEYFEVRSKEKGIWYKTIVCEPPRIPWFSDGKLGRMLIKIAFRLRSGHVPLNKFAYLMKKSLSPNCEACQKPEDLYHILLECAKNASERQQLFRLLDINILDLGVFQHILSKPTTEECKLVCKFILYSLRE